MKAQEFMTKDVHSCKEDQSVQEAATLMIDKHISALPIVDNSNKLIGIITQSDFVGKEIDIPHAMVSVKQLLGQSFNFGSAEDVFKKAKNIPISQVMTKKPVSIASDMTLTQVVNLMAEKNYKRLPVVDGNKLVGIITRTDILKAFRLISEQKAK